MIARAVDDCASRVLPRSKRSNSSPFHSFAISFLLFPLFFFAISFFQRSSKLKEFRSKSIDHEKDDRVGIGIGIGRRTGKEEEEEKKKTSDKDEEISLPLAMKFDVLATEHERTAMKFLTERDKILRELAKEAKEGSFEEEFAQEDSRAFGMGADDRLMSYKRMSGKNNLCNEAGTNANCPKRSNANERMNSTKFPKIYVYDVPKELTSELAKKYGRCERDQYGTEIWFHRFIRDDENGVRTLDPGEADFFFVPQYGECFLWSREMLRHENQNQATDETNEYFLDVLSNVKKMPYFNKTDGRDHVFVFAGARGPTIFRDWKREIPNSIYLTPEGDRTLPQFDTWKDIVIPGLEYDKRLYRAEHRQVLVDEPPKRKFLAMFRGTIDHPAGFAYSKGLRPKLKQIFANASDVIYDTKVKDCDRDCYVREMTESVFCLNPLGWTPWTLRFYQAVMTRCIPVIIADNIEFPFESEINYSEFTLKIPEKDVSDILETMRDMPESERERRRRAMDSVWMKFTYQKPPEFGDAYYSTIKELGRKVRAHKLFGPHSFW